MPRDPRPFVTYPVNYTSHPRIESLSDPAFRVWHLMMDYSRVHGLDGRIPQPIADKRWAKRAIAELVRGIDDRPLVALADGVYVIRSYAEHQFTTEDAAALREKRANAGRAGGKAKANAKQGDGNPLASATENGWQNLAESESELEVELERTTDTAQLPKSSPDPNVRAKGLDPLQELIHEKEELATERAAILGIRNPTAAHTRLQTALSARITLLTAIDLAAVILDKAKGNVIDPDAYLARACQKPDEIRQHFANLDAEALV